jgi:ABC-2 type transport system permease protein
MIRRILMVASREFTTTVVRKGFIVGVLLGPVFILVLVNMIPRILNSKSPQVVGDVAVYDPSGTVIPGLQTALDPAAIAAARKARAQTPPAVSPGPGGGPALPPIPRLTVLPRDADVKAGKAWLLQDEHHLALVMLRPDAVVRPEGASDFGTYDLYVSPRLDEGTEATINEGVRQALVATRLKSSGLDQTLVEAAMRVARPNSVIVAAAGERSAQRGIARTLPFISGILLFIGVMVGGQTLLTSTVEEKSSRVVEMLLAAVSPVELMWGKLIGQLGVGLIMMAAYLALGVSALAQFALSGMLDPMLIVYLVVFYFIAYLVYGALMLAVGAAVNQMADAQSLMGPIMMLLVAPYVLTGVIGQAPNSAFSVALSFIPPVNSFAMLARLATSTPPPTWQVLATIAVGLLSAAGTVWFAAKIFKIGLLMQGKPPSFATLVRWARMA